MKDERQDQIMKLLLREGFLKTDYMVDYFGVSIETIRRDINTLARAGLVKKVYGGICLSSVRLTSLEAWNVRMEQCHEEKAGIAAAALSLIEDHSVIALDIGTTTYELSRLLVAKKDLSVLTSSLRIAGELAQNTSHKVYCIGGLVSPDEQVTSGLFSRIFMDNFAAIDLFIAGADGITLKSGITEYNEAVVDVKKQIFQRSRKKAVLADHSKFGKEALYIACPISDLDVLITDNKTPQNDLEMIQKMGIEVIAVPIP